MSHSSRLPSWVAGFGNLVGVLLLFFAIPIQVGETARGLALSIALSLVGAVVVVVVVAREVAGQRVDGKPTLRVIHVILLLEVVLLAFALTYYVLEANVPGQIVDLDTRVDALYFTISTTATVGFGDIHAVGQAARVLVTIQIGFNVIFVAAAARLVTARLDEVRAGKG